MADTVRAALRALTQADRDARRVLRLVAGIPGMEAPDVPDLVRCTFQTDKRTYHGRLTAQQCERLAEVSGQPALKVERRLLALLRLLRRALGYLAECVESKVPAVQQALHPRTVTTLRVQAKLPDSLGSCAYTNSDGNPDCVDYVLVEDCNKLPDGVFTQGVPCPPPRPPAHPAP